MGGQSKIALQLIFLIRRPTVRIPGRLPIYGGLITPNTQISCPAGIPKWIGSIPLQPLCNP